MSERQPPREIVIPHVTPIAPVTAVRSTLIQASIATLRARGHFERYVALLEPAQRELVLQCTAPSWLPVAAGAAHYRACDALMLGDAELTAIGESVGDRMQGPFMDALTRAARAMGVSPVGLIKRFHVLWSRLFQGGSFEVLRVGPKDLTIEIRSSGLCEFSYFRHALCGVVRAAYKYVGVQVAYVRIVRWDARADSFTMHAAWV